MENEILAQILTELKALNGKQESIDQRLDSMDRRFDSMERQQSNMAEELTAFQEFTLQKFEVMEQRFDGLENEQKKTNLIIENEIRPSSQALVEGQMSMQAQLDRIEAKVTTHDEIIFKRVK